jgi:hypothetical protein
MAGIALALCLTLGAEAEPQTSYEYVPIGRVKPGSVLFAFPPHGGKAPIASDLFALSELEQAAVADDKIGMTELKNQGRLFMVLPGTAVKILEHHEANEILKTDPAYEVRILEGEFAGKKGWVWDDWLRWRVRVATKAKHKRR